MLASSKNTPFTTLSIAAGYFCKSEIRYSFRFNGKELDKEIYGDGNALDFGARIYDGRLGRWMSCDPLQMNYADLSPYNFVSNMPISAIDPDGRDIIVLADREAAKGAGHQAVLIGDDKNGWMYISKDGADNGGAIGKPGFTITQFKNLEEFRNSPHNFDLMEGQNHSLVNGGENKDITFKLDKNGKKIQRYEEAFYIKTIKKDGTSTDNESIIAAYNQATAIYCLSLSDCSDVATAALREGQNYLNRPLNTPVEESLTDEFPNNKQKSIEKYNVGKDVDNLIVPDNLMLNDGEKGKYEGD
jgi:RHS repeat-associated protein